MRDRLWEAWKQFYRSRIVQGMLWMGMSLIAILVIARYFAEKGLDLMRLQLQSNGSFDLTFSPWVLALLVIWTFLAWWFIWPRGRAWQATEVNVEVARIGKIVMKPNQEVAGLAHRAWSEIATRKAGLPFDEDNDVIAEVYDSWYALFAEFRTLVKSIPVDRLRAEGDAQQLCDFLIKVLNTVLRPHLTRYQARFRAWFTDALTKAPGTSPQEIQRQFPDYDELVADLKATNDEFVSFAAALKQIARAEG